jgi:hypothetical protein
MRATTITGAALAATLLAACGGGGKQPEYANDADTGAAAPATQQTLSPNPAMGDSTQGLQERTGQPQAAGDSGRPTITGGMDTSKGQNAPPVPPPATKRP